MIDSLKLKFDAVGEKTMHDIASILVGCMKSFLSVLGSWRYCKAWLSPCYEKLLASLSDISEGGECNLPINLPLLVWDQCLIQCW